MFTREKCYTAVTGAGGSQFPHKKALAINIHGNRMKEWIRTPNKSNEKKWKMLWIWRCTRRSVKGKIVLQTSTKIMSSVRIAFKEGCIASTDLNCSSRRYCSFFKPYKVQNKTSRWCNLEIWDTFFKQADHPVRRRGKIHLLASWIYQLIMGYYTLSKFRYTIQRLLCKWISESGFAIHNSTLIVVILKCCNSQFLDHSCLWFFFVYFSGDPFCKYQFVLNECDFPHCLQI